ncbi:Uncharacterised protein [Mycobacterium tuberculosis]|nr:Uncharacterised protein [Mycobacterium tuberculosis]
MACPVNAVEITASAMMTGTKVAARLWPNEPIGSKVSPTSRVIGMNMVNSSCSPLRNSSFNSRLNCAASIRGTALGRGSGLKVPAGKAGRLVWVPAATSCR